MANSTTGYMTIPKLAERVRSMGIPLGSEALWAEVRAGRLRAVLRRGMQRGMLVSERELSRWLREEWEAVGGD